MRKLNLLGLAGATYMMVSGGPYGIEELVGTCGYGLAIAVLLLVPVLWSLPVGLMVGELSAAVPADGGYYVWVRRALGSFWGFQEAWLSLAASVFDMTAYLALFVLCVSRIWPVAMQYSFWIGTGIIVLSVLWNLLGAKPVGDGSLLLALLLLAPFAVLIAAAFTHPGAPPPMARHPQEGGILAGMLVAMWNYMGWDNASTIAGEVRNPQRNYPRVMTATLLIICLCYVVPVLAVEHRGVPVNAWTTGSWVSIAGALGGKLLGLAMALGSLVSTFAIFNSLTLSISRLPLAMAEDGWAPRILSKRLSNGAPCAALIACGILWTCALGLAFDRLVLLDILLYGASLILEFVALTYLRLAEPHLPRPFRVPGGVAGTVVAAVGPAALLLCALVKSRSDTLGGVSAFAVGGGIAIAGLILGLVAAPKQSPRPQAAAADGKESVA